jgi:hypothetical protein
MVFLELGQGMHANIIGKMIFSRREESDVRCSML